MEAEIRHQGHHSKLQTHVHGLGWDSQWLWVQVYIVLNCFLWANKIPFGGPLGFRQEFFFTLATLPWSHWYSKLVLQEVCGFLRTSRKRRNIISLFDSSAKAIFCSWLSRWTTHWSSTTNTPWHWTWSFLVFSFFWIQHFQTVGQKVTQEMLTCLTVSVRMLCTHGVNSKFWTRWKGPRGLPGKGKGRNGGGQHGLCKGDQYYDDKWKPNFWWWVHCSVYRSKNMMYTKMYKML